MRALIAGVVLTLAAALPAWAQKLPLKLAEGATWTFTARHDREIAGDPAHSFSITTVKRLTWRPGRLRMEHVSVEANSGMPPEFAYTQTLAVPVEFEVDDTLAPNGVRNFDEVRAATRALILKSGADPNEVARADGQMIDQTAMALVGRELGLIARAQGTNLKPGLPLPSEDDTPNPMGGPPIRARIIYALDSYDAAAGKAVVTWRSSLDEQSMRDSLSEMAEQAPPEKRDEARAAFAKMKIASDRACRNEIDIRTGLATRIECVNTVAVGSPASTRQSTDRWTITQTLPGTTP